MIGRTLALLDAITSGLAWLANLVAALVLVGMTALILTEIALRNLFLLSTHMTEEFVAYGLMAVVLLAAASALREGGLIRVDLVVDRLNPRARRWLEMVHAAVALAAILFLFRHAGATFQRRWRTGTVSWSPAEVPLWIPQGIALVGLAIFALALAVYLLRLMAGGPVLAPSQRIE
jgi:TRAP-type C4-dicarboxylate transport system permease small subunit